MIREKMKDLKNKKLRTIRDVNIVFNEDSLRIVRAISFQRRLGFEFCFNMHEFLHLVDFNKEEVRRILK